MALVDAYHEAVTGAADPVAATQDGAVAAGDAVDLPHLGRCPVPNIVPAVARPGVNGDGEALGNGLLGRTLVDPLHLPSNGRMPRLGWTAIAEVLERTQSMQAAASKALTDGFRFADISEAMMQVVQLNEADAVGFQNASRWFVTSWRCSTTTTAKSASDSSSTNSC